MKCRKGFMAIVILLLVAIGVSGYCYQSVRTPEYALDQLMDGVAEHDAQKVQRYADIASIVTKGTTVARQFSRAISSAFMKSTRRTGSSATTRPS